MDDRDQSDLAEAEAVRDALLRQWRLIAATVPSLDLAAPSRIPGWTNREVVAHLCIQPRLLAQFLQTASRQPPTVTVASNLAGTRGYQEVIDRSARAVDDADLDFAAQVDAVVGALLRADLGITVTTLQGPIGLADYLRTRCVEAVVHGRDLREPAPVDGEAAAIAAAALSMVIERDHPEVLGVVRTLPTVAFVDAATGRTDPPDALRGVLPVLR